MNKLDRLIQAFNQRNFFTRKSKHHREKRFIQKIQAAQRKQFCAQCIEKRESKREEKQLPQLSPLYYGFR